MTPETTDPDEYEFKDGDLVASVAKAPGSSTLRVSVLEAVWEDGEFYFAIPVRYSHTLTLDYETLSAALSRQKQLEVRYGLKPTVGYREGDRIKTKAQRLQEALTRD